MQIHLFASVLVVGASVFFELSQTEWVQIIFCITWVWFAEAINTALEFLTDLVSPNSHPMAGHAKDVAAAGVLITAIGAAIIGIIIFFPKVVLWINSI